MSEYAVKVENIGKKFQLGLIGSADLRETITLGVRKLFGMRRPNIMEEKEFWALRDISFEVKHGEVVGIIGKNGAGKSTLLKVLSRISEPTTGRIVVNGRVSSLLEVGTGFNPELTGRENVFLNGSILGMSRKEIRRNFDEIVAFSGVERFIDTPVKRYSSGMYVRLAFAVAAHLEPEILIIDEVLSVGDAEFQQKCIGKMDEVSRSGRTVLFVSHNMGAVKKLCKRGIVLQSGEKVFEGNSIEAVNYYLSMAMMTDLQHYWEAPDPETQKANPVRFTRARILDERGEGRIEFSSNEDIILEMEAYVDSWPSYLRMVADIIDSQETLIFRTGHNDAREILDGDSVRKGFHTFRFTIPRNILNREKYYISIRIGNYRAKEWIEVFENVLGFQVFFDLENKNLSLERGKGLLAPILDWTTADRKLV